LARFCVFRIQRQPFLKPWFGIRLDGIDGTFRFANATVDAFLGMDDEHVLALVEAVDGAHGDAVHGFAANAAIVDDVSQPRIHDVTTDTENPPDVAPLKISLPPDQAFGRALDTAKTMPDWIVVAADPKAGRIEARQTTRWFRFTDDVVIRVAAEASGSRIDSTPMPEASLAQSSSGLCRSSIEKAFGPGSPAPVRVQY
jgi:uncharacterized protein (DUF1499 family)